MLTHDSGNFYSELPSMIPKSNCSFTFPTPLPLPWMEMDDMFNTHPSRIPILLASPFHMLKKNVYAFRYSTEILCNTRKSDMNYPCSINICIIRVFASHQFWFIRNMRKIQNSSLNVIVRHRQGSDIYEFDLDKFHCICILRNGNQYEYSVLFYIQTHFKL